MTTALDTVSPAPVVISTKNPGNYATLITYLALTALGAARFAVGPEEVFTAAALIQVLLAIAGAFVVWQGATPRAKLIGAGVVAGLQALVPLVTNYSDFGAITWQDYIGVLFAALAASGVLIPNQPLVAAPVSADGVHDVSSLPPAPVEIDDGPDHRADPGPWHGGNLS